MDEPIPQAAAFRIQLPTFEGPLDLLLHLIRKHELDILDLPIAFVTERYLDYLQMMQELDLDVASEYLLMAATLAHIKSKSLLPTIAPDQIDDADEAYQEDPRAELIRRLLEYQKYKAAGDQLAKRPMAGRDVFQRGMSAPEAQGPAPLAGIELYKLLDAIQNILKRVSGRVALEVTAERITIGQRISELSDMLRIKRGCAFEELFESARTRYEVVVTFLALLEMTKLRITRIYQADPKSTLHVHYALLDADSPTVPPESADFLPPSAATEDDLGSPLMAAEDDPSTGAVDEETGDVAVAEPASDDEYDEPAASFDDAFDAAPEAIDFDASDAFAELTEPASASLDRFEESTEVPAQPLMAADDEVTDQPLMAAEADADLRAEEAEPTILHEAQPEEIQAPDEQRPPDADDESAIDPDEVDEPAAQFDEPLDATPQAVDFDVEPSAEIDVHNDEPTPQLDQDDESGAADAEEKPDESKA
ncbi:MAG TPA: segregation/condensation protein A [Polyangiales bacterium]|nr:segregation/condensation protein A [Polyangiales bacterium]